MADKLVDPLGDFIEAIWSKDGKINAFINRTDLIEAIWSRGEIPILFLNRLDLIESIYSQMDTQTAFLNRLDLVEAIYSYMDAPNTFINRLDFFWHSVSSFMDIGEAVYSNSFAISLHTDFRPVNAIWGNDESSIAYIIQETAYYYKFDDVFSEVQYYENLDDAYNENIYFSTFDDSYSENIYLEPFDDFYEERVYYFPFDVENPAYELIDFGLDFVQIVKKKMGVREKQMIDLLEPLGYFLDKFKR